jgi:hypothetical protein
LSAGYEDQLQFPWVWSASRDASETGTDGEIRALGSSVTTFVFVAGLMIPGDSTYRDSEMQFDVWPGDELDWASRAATLWATVEVVDTGGPFELVLTARANALVEQVRSGTAWDAIDFAQIVRESRQLPGPEGDQ